MRRKRNKLSAVKYSAIFLQNALKYKSANEYIHEFLVRKESIQCLTDRIRKTFASIVKVQKNFKRIAKMKQNIAESLKLLVAREHDLMKAHFAQKAKKNKKLRQLSELFEKQIDQQVLDL